MKRILLVEDEADLAFGIQANLEIDGYAVRVAPSVASARSDALGAAPDLIILDLTLPDGDGLLLLKELRARGVDSPVLILTARSSEAERANGFECGADDYVTKPFSLLELLLRVRALLRRARSMPAEAPEHIVRVGDVTVSVDGHLCLRNGEVVALTPKALALLRALLAARGRVATRHSLLREVWGYDTSVSSRTVDTHVAELRRKLEPDPVRPRLIVTVWKAGYRVPG